MNARQRKRKAAQRAHHERTHRSVGQVRDVWPSMLPRGLRNVRVVSKIFAPETVGRPDFNVNTSPQRQPNEVQPGDLAFTDWGTQL